VATSRSEPAISAGRTWQRLDLVKHWSLHPLHDKLGNPVAALETH
jgi:hypothetical protein